MSNVWSMAMLAAALPGIATAATTACSAESGAATVAVVELFTSEGCDSCPPADRWLSTSLPAPARSGRAVALAFHVDYWDRLGWKDRFASPAYTARQQAAMRANGLRFVYTPQVLLQGRHADWRDRALATHIATINERPPRAALALFATAHADGVRVRLTGMVPHAGDRAHARAVVAWTESGLVSQVSAGENAGARLAHDHVVRDLHEAAATDREGRIALEHVFGVPAERGAHSTIVALVQDARTGDILQALAIPACGAPPR